MLVWKPWRTVSSANAGRAGAKPAARTPAPAARHCRRVIVLIAPPPRPCRAPVPPSSVLKSLLLLQAELADAGRNLVQCLCDHLPQFRRRRCARNGAGLLDHGAVFVGADDRRDAALQQV